MDELYVKLQERNKRETLPFIPIFESYTALLKLSDDLQRRIQEADQEMLLLQQRKPEDPLPDTPTPSSSQSKALTMALRNETRLRDRLEHLEEAFDAKVKSEAAIRAEAAELTAKVRDMKDVDASQKLAIRNLSDKLEKLSIRTASLEDRLQESNVDRSLAEKQNEGLKQTIRELQETNRTLEKQNESFGDRLITDKERMVNELNQLNDVIAKLENENEELRALLNQNQEKRKKAIEAAKVSTSTWFGVFGGTVSADQNDKTETSSSRAIIETGSAVARNDKSTMPQPDSRSNEQQLVVVCPSKQHLTIQAHSNEGTCLRFDRHDSQIFATCSIGGSVKTWNAKSGACCSVFYCMAGQTVLSCDVSRSMVAGAGTDKTCRIWDTSKNRMIHQLAGHSHKVTSVRILNNHQNILTCSADRSLKLWDVSKQTYTMSATMTFKSISSSIDVVTDGRSAVSGHVDGSLLIWDLETAQKTGEIKGIQDGGITTVCMDPQDRTRVWINCLASGLRMIDVRVGKAIRTLQHDDFSTSHGHAGCAISPNGQFIAAGSDSGEVFVWDVVKGTVQTRLSYGGVSTIVGIDWRENRDKESPQIATLDRKGSVVLWA